MPIDCDVHNEVPGARALYPYLPDYWIEQFDVMLVKAQLEWSGPAGFDDWIDIAVTPTRIGTKSFDLRYRGVAQADEVARQ